MNDPSESTIACGFDSQKAFARLLLSSSPENAFNPSALLLHSGMGNPCMRASQTVMGVNDDSMPEAEPSARDIKQGIQFKQGDEGTMTAPIASRTPRDSSMSEQSAAVQLSPMRRDSISAVASIGALGTLWLSLEKLGLLEGLLGDSSICPSEGCSLVLQGPYSSVGGIPLAEFGFLAYCLVAYLAQAPERIVFSAGEGRRAVLETNQMLVAAVSTMAMFSGYLMAILAFVIKAACQVCIGSAVLSMTQAALVWWEGGVLESRRSSLSTTAASALASSLFAAALVVSGDPATFVDNAPSFVKEQMISKEVKQQLADQQEFELAFRQKRTPRILRQSSKQALAVARRLKSKGAVMYGAFWCGHCYDQKKTLGAEAMSMLTYVECGRDAIPELNDAKRCTAEKIEGYPTWEIDGKRYGGEKSVQALEDILDGKVKPSDFSDDD